MTQVGIYAGVQDYYGNRPTFDMFSVLNPNLKTDWIFDDFLWYNSYYHGVWAGYEGGAGAGSGQYNGDQTRPGIGYGSTGTTNAGYGGFSTSLVWLIMGAGVFTVEGEIYLPDLSAVAEEYTFYFGFGDTRGADIVDGAYFKYNRLTGVNWLGVTANNSARTETDLGIAVQAATWTKLKVVVNADGTAVSYYIGGVLVGTNVLNIPTARNTGAIIQIIKSAGITSRSFRVDWLWLKHDLTVTR